MFINILYSVLLGIIPITIYFYKTKTWLVFLFLIISLLLILWCYFLSSFSILDLLYSLINKLTTISIRDNLVSWINNSYNQQTSSFINMIVLNVKNSLSYPMYDKLVDLSIVYMVVISGFHLTILKYVIKKVFKNKVISNTINISFIFFYCFLLKFSLSAMRVLLCLLIKLISKNKVNKYDILGISGLILIFLNPNASINYGFCLSYLCTCVIYFIFDLKIENVFWEKVLINVSAILISLPFVLMMNKQISIWSLFLALIFTYIFCFIFIYFLFTFWIIWIAPFHNLLINTIIHIIYAFTLVNIVIKFDWLPTLVVCSYYYVYFLLIIYFNNKNKRINHDTYFLRRG